MKFYWKTVTLTMHNKEWDYIHEALSSIRFFERYNLLSPPPPCFFLNEIIIRLKQTVKCSLNASHSCRVAMQCTLYGDGRTHQRGEKGMCHCKFLYLISKREGAMRASRQETVTNSELAQVGHYEAFRVGALWDQEDRSTCLNVQQHTSRSLWAITHLQGRK